MRNEFLLLLAILLMHITSALCQTKIVYDFNNGNYDVPVKAVRSGEGVILHIKNVNTFRYEVTIQGRNIDYVTQVPSELQLLFALPQNDIAQEVDDAQNSAKEIPSIAKNMDNVETTVAATSPLRLTMDTLTTACNKYGKLAIKIANYKYNRMALINASKQRYNNARLMRRAILRYISIDSKMKQDYLEFIKLYVEVERLYEKAASEATLTSPTHETPIKDAERKLEEAHHKIVGENGDGFLKIIEDIVTLQKALVNEKNFNVISPPIQMDGDFVELVISITPTPVNSLMPFEQAVEFNVEIPGFKGWKADFSVGPTMSFGEGAKDSIFYLTQVTPETNSIGENENKNSMRPSIAAMMHFYQRRSNDVAFGWLFGVGAGFKSIDDVNLSLFFGGSVILGKSRKIMVSGGVSYLKVDRIKSQYEVGQIISSEIEVKDLTNSVFKPSFFFSVSYNLTNRVEVN